MVSLPNCWSVGDPRLKREQKALPCATFLFVKSPGIPADSEGQDFISR